MGNELSAEQIGDAIEAIDAANSQDPAVLEVGGRSGPKELLHSQMMTDWVSRLDPEADSAQLIAARAHHFRRWTRPRSDYPEGRAGYRRWRTAAARSQAQEVGAILTEVGATQEFVDRVSQIIRKEGLGSDPAVQTHEDALCLVFLETQLDDIIDSLGVEHSTEVLAKTIPKMSQQGLVHAATLELSEKGRSVLADGLDAAKSEAPQ